MIHDKYNWWKVVDLRLLYFHLLMNAGNHSLGYNMLLDTSNCEFEL